MTLYRLRYDVRLTAQRSDGAHVQQIGMRVGYWPCLAAPFFEVAIGKWIVAVWFGLPKDRA